MSRKARQTAARTSAAEEIDALLGGADPKAPGNKRRRGRRADVGAGEGARETRLPQGRVVAICLVFLAAMGMALARFADLAAEGEFGGEQGAGEVLREHEDAEAAADGKASPARGAAREKAADKQVAAAPARPEPRAPIVDRNGQPLARDLTTYELYLDAEAFALREKKWPNVDREELAEAAAAIAGAFPGRFETKTLLTRLSRARTTLLARPLTAREAQRAHDLGVPGLYLVRRLDRYYPAGALTAHAVGYVDIDGVGKAGVEAGLDAALKAHPDQPMRLSLDLRAQRVVRDALAAGMAKTGAKAASGVVLSAETGEVLALVSLPDFDPHHRPPNPKGSREQEDSPLFFRSVIGQYELGSVLKIVTWALALETGVAKMSDSFEALPPLKIDQLEIAGERPMSFPLAFAKSSNRIAAELALRAGRRKQQALFEALGFFADTPLEVGGASVSARGRGKAWSEIDMVSASYGYRVQISPLHMAAAVASLVNGGELVKPTLLPPPPGALAAPRLRVVRAETSRRVRELLRMVVEEGTGKSAASPGLRVGGKTGTAERVDENTGEYLKNAPGRASFVGAFPIDRPEYVVSVMLDGPSVMVRGKPSTSAGHTAAPVAKDIIEGVAPLLGVVPRQVAAARLLGEPEIPPRRP